jgi:hypothetical protein
LVVLTNLLERLPLVADKIAADGGLHVFRKRRDLDDAITTVPVPVQYNCFQQEHSSEVSSAMLYI